MKVKIGPYLDDGSHCYDTRKIEVKIHDYDTWSMDHTLAVIILPMLKQLKETQHAFPSDVAKDESTMQWPQQSFDFYIESDNMALEKGEKEWNAILDKMIFAFEKITELDRYWFDGEIEEKIDEGCRLFGQYYRSLWD